MKKLFAILFCLSTLLSCEPVMAQADIVVDSVNVAKSLQVYEFTPTNNQLFCPYDIELIHPGYNITLTWTLDIANLGNMNAHLGCGDGSTPGVEYDSCRGYNKYTGFCEFTLSDKNCNVLAETEKAYYAIATSQHYLATGAPWYAERLAWLQRQCGCIIDVDYFNSLPDTSDGTTLCPVLGPGYLDRYNTTQYGNWLNIEAPLSSLVVGETYYFEAELYPDAVPGVNDANVFSNSSGKIPFRWDGIGADGKNHLTVLDQTAPRPVCCTDPAPPSPAKIQIKGGNMLTWSAVPGASYIVYARMAYDVHGKICETCWHEWQTMTTTTATAVTVPTLPGTWQYAVTAKNCGGESEKIISRKD